MTPIGVAYSLISVALPPDYSPKTDSFGHIKRSKALTQQTFDGGGGVERGQKGGCSPGRPGLRSSRSLAGRTTKRELWQIAVIRARPRARIIRPTSIA